MDWTPIWNYTADNDLHVMAATFGKNVTGDSYPVLSITEYDGSKWNVQLNAGVMDGDVNIDIPKATTGAKVSEEIRILIAQGAGNAYNLTLASPTGDYICLPDGTKATSVQIVPTADKITELSLCNIGAGNIAVLSAEW